MDYLEEKKNSSNIRSVLINLRKHGEQPTMTTIRKKQKENSLRCNVMCNVSHPIFLEILEILLFTALHEG